MAEDEKKVDEEGFLLNEEGERVVDEDGNPVLDVELPPKTEEEGKVKELAELKERLAAVERERDGIKHDLFSERERRRVAEEVKESGLKPEKMSKEELEEFYSEPMTRGEFERERELLLVDMAKSNQAPSVAAARQRYDDFDEVSKFAEELLANPDNKFMADNVNYAPDYGEAKYQLGKTHSKYLDKIRQEAVKETIDNIKKNVGKSSSSAGTTGKGQKSLDEVSLTEYGKMSAEQRAALPQSTRERLMGGMGNEE